MTCAQPRTKTRTSISRNICCLTSGFQILYAVEQFSSICLKDKLKKKELTYTKPMIRLPRAMSWANCLAAPTQQLPHVLCGDGI